MAICNGPTKHALLFVLVASLMFEGQQLAHADWTLPQTDTCPLADLPARIDGVYRACCIQGDESVCINGSPPAECSLDCAATLVPFFTECSDVLNAYFDSDDGVEDNAAKARKASPK